MEDPVTTPVVAATLFEGGYEVGARALINSLSAAGLASTVWCGYRGPRPSWPSEVKGIRLNLVALDTTVHLTHYKPLFLRDVLGWDDEASGVVYFDPDIVVNCPWAFIEDWVSSGIAACGDVNWLMPASSPVRARWVRLCRDLGIADVDRASMSPFDIYCNAGFVGVSRSSAGFLDAWASVTDALIEWGADPSTMTINARTSVLMALDQDAFNIALMLSSSEVALMGPEAMDFAPGGQIMSHAIGAPKPWQKRFVREAMAGRPPSKRDRAFLQFTQGPLGIYSSTVAARRWTAYRLARVIGNFWKRTDY